MHYGKTLVDVAADAAELGERAASAIATVMRERLAQADEVRMILAGGESQTAFLERLAVEPDLDWQRVACFNMDDFWDLRLPQEYSVGQFTITKLYEKVRPKATHLEISSPP